MCVCVCVCVYMCMCVCVMSPKRQVVGHEVAKKTSNSDFCVEVALSCLDGRNS